MVTGGSPGCPRDGSSRVGHGEQVYRGGDSGTCTPPKTGQGHLLLGCAQNTGRYHVRVCMCVCVCVYVCVREGTVERVLCRRQAKAISFWGALKIPVGSTLGCVCVCVCQGGDSGEGSAAETSQGHLLLGGAQNTGKS